MIIGKTKKQKFKEKQYRILDEFFSGVKKFAYIPIKLDDGTYVWLDTYYEQPQVSFAMERESIFWHNSTINVCYPQYIKTHQWTAPDGIKTGSGLLLSKDEVIDKLDSYYHGK